MAADTLVPMSTGVPLSLEGVQEIVVSFRSFKTLFSEQPSSDPLGSLTLLPGSIDVPCPLANEEVRKAKIVINIDDGLVDVPSHFNWQDFTGLAARKACHFQVVRDEISGRKTLHVTVDMFLNPTYWPMAQLLLFGLLSQAPVASSIVSAIILGEKRPEKKAVVTGALLALFPPYAVYLLWVLGLGWVIGLGFFGRLSLYTTLVWRGIKWLCKKVWLELSIFLRD